jgi:hypothetical protein
MGEDQYHEFKEAVREVGKELSRSVEQANRLARQACEDLMNLVGEPRRTPPDDTQPTHPEESPVDAIRQLAALRDEGLITAEEFDAKKAELLRRI